ncbi:MAG: anti-phage ZorAB system protein ZorA [Pseudomonadota bacterium]
MAPLENTSHLDLSPILEPFNHTANIAWLCIENQTLAPLFEIGVTEIFTFSIGILFFLALSIYTFVMSLYCVRYIFLGFKLRNLTKVANTPDTEEKISQQRSILKRINPYFLDSLTEYNGKLYSNQDIETFFSTKSLAPSILHSKLLPLAPILLTGLGVLGTFLGLQLGLSGLELDGDTDKLQHGIRAVAEGAAVAFATSVYGVSSSLLLNIVEKIYSAICSRTIHALQATLEQLFPPFPVMNVFTAIEQYNKNFDENLGGLAEQIGLTMQQSFQETSQNLGSQFANTISSASKDISTSLVESINSSLVPAVESISNAAHELGSRQANSAENTLSALIEKFSAGMGEEGKHQREAMANATAKMEATLADFNEAMQSVIQGLHDKQSSLAETQEHSMQQLHENMQITLQQQQSMMSVLQDTVTKHMGASESVIAQGQALHNDTKQTQNTLISISESLEKTSGNMTSASVELHSFSDNIRSSMEQTATSVSNAMTIVQKTSSDYQIVSSQFKETRDSLEDLQNTFTSASTEVKNSIQKAHDGFEVVFTQYTALQNNLQTYTKEMGEATQNQVKALDDHMTNLLANYGNAVNGQVQERMNAWNEQTTAYTNTMKSVVQEMAGIIENLDQHSKQK